mmetsp:Transcript_26211/g.34997  ORF Transcript_26211/g.34997 Transcript_26211/m.34997 type:complete len:95 (-) Transcript_26211:39-323(-)
MQIRATEIQVEGVYGELNESRIEILNTIASTLQAKARMVDVAKVIRDKVGTVIAKKVEVVVKEKHDGATIAIWSSSCLQIIANSLKITLWIPMP